MRYILALFEQSLAREVSKLNMNAKAKHPAYILRDVSRVFSFYFLSSSKEFWLKEKLFVMYSL